MSNFPLLCSRLTVKFLSFGYSCNIQGFWYFAQSRSCKIQVNLRNPTKFTNLIHTQNAAKFGRKLIKYIFVQHIWNLSQLLGLFTCCKVANLSWNFVTQKCKQRPKTKVCFKRCATAVLSWLDCRSTATRH